MVPDIFANYFLASSGAGAALIGLLFVAVSIHPEYTLGRDAHPLRRGVASGAFTALTNAFFVSMSALIPLANVGVITIVVSVISVGGAVNLGRAMLRENWGARHDVSRTAIIRVAVTFGVSMILYAYEGSIGVALLLHPRNVGFTFTLAELLLGVYALGLARAWELLGGPDGPIRRLLNPLQDLRDAPTASSAAAADSQPSASQVGGESPRPRDDAQPSAR